MVYIYSKQHAHGIVIIVNNLIEAFIRRGIDCTRIETLDGRTSEDFIIPYGVMEANELIKSGLPTRICFPADAITLGYINKIKFYFKNNHIFNYDFFYSIYALVKYYPKEKKMIDAFDTNILVSPVDINYFKKHFSKSDSKYIYVTNGIDLVEVAEKTNSDCFRIGILSSWQSRQIFEESNWFIRKYFMKYVKSHPSVQLIIAGRGPRCEAFKGIQNICVIGEVESLKDFFSKIDVMVSSNPKGCGILNRVLDAFAYKVPVCGIRASFTGFPDSDNCYFSFTDYDSFCNVMDRMMNDRGELIRIADNAYKYIQQNNNWNKLYDDLVRKLTNKYLTCPKLNF